jgi:hypothetical protein
MEEARRVTQNVSLRRPGRNVVQFSAFSTSLAALTAVDLSGFTGRSVPNTGVISISGIKTPVIESINVVGPDAGKSVVRVFIGKSSVGCPLVWGIVASGGRQQVSANFPDGLYTDEAGASVRFTTSVAGVTLAFTGYVRDADPSGSRAP